MQHRFQRVFQFRIEHLQSVLQVITFLTADGLVSLSDSRGLASALQEPDLPQRTPLQPLPSLAEQGLCVAATFLLAASNGRDGGGRKVQVRHGWLCHCL